MENLDRLEAPYIRVQCREGMAHTTTVYLVEKDGKETPIDVPIRRMVLTADSEDGWVNAEITFEGVKVDGIGKADVAATRELVQAEYERTMAALDELDR